MARGAPPPGRRARHRAPAPRTRPRARARRPHRDGRGRASPSTRSTPRWGPAASGSRSIRRRPARATLGAPWRRTPAGPAAAGRTAPRGTSSSGLRVVAADGQLIRAGGKVVKNVAGDHLAKLYIGILQATLGIIVDATLKLRPRPEAEGACWATFASLDAAAAAAVALAGSELGPVVLPLLDARAADACAPVGLPAAVAPAVLVAFDGLCPRRRSGRARRRRGGLRAAGAQHRRGPRRRPDRPARSGRVREPRPPSPEPGGDRRAGACSRRRSGRTSRAARTTAQAGRVRARRASRTRATGCVTLVLAHGGAPRPAAATAAVLAAWREAARARGGHLAVELGAARRARRVPGVGSAGPGRGSDARAQGAARPAGRPESRPLRGRHLMGRRRRRMTTATTTPPRPMAAGRRASSPSSSTGSSSSASTAACACRAARRTPSSGRSPTRRAAASTSSRRSPTAGSSSAIPRPSISRSASDAGRARARAPRGCQYGHLIEAARAELEVRRPGSPVRRLVRRAAFDGLLPRPALLRLVAGALRFYQRSGLQRLVRASGLLRLFPATLAASEARRRPLPPAGRGGALPERIPARAAPSTGGTAPRLRAGRRVPAQRGDHPVPDAPGRRGAGPADPGLLWRAPRARRRARARPRPGARHHRRVRGRRARGGRGPTPPGAGRT